MSWIYILEQTWMPMIMLLLVIAFTFYMFSIIQSYREILKHQASTINAQANSITHLKRQVIDLGGVGTVSKYKHIKVTAISANELDI